ncbi:protein translocase subunit SecD [Candidatus Gottesmanbacteria bacterium]|nr:protein translocase subunit SecD [Candidatus Gottesmanbacteria bacterium]
MFRNPRRVLILLFLLTAVFAVVDLPENYRVKFSLFGRTVDRIINPPTLRLFGWTKEIKTSLGLDLAGGSHVVLEADMKDIKASDRVTALESAKEVIDRRVNFFGVSEPVVQTAISENSYRIIVELPGVNDVDRAISLIGQTALLDFREFTDPDEATTGAFVVPMLTNTKSVGLTGRDLSRASMQFSPQTGEPEVQLEFNGDGGKKFADATTRLVGKPIAIFLDEVPLTSPVVQTPILDGKAVITGTFTQEAARTLALQLNAGALPVPVHPVEQRTVEATLGAESVAKSITAGAIGLGFVAIFMILQYGRLGLIADMALVLYGLLSFGVFRLFNITLTLPGIAGFLLSIGMAVDSNILIFERYKEELHAGKPWNIAMEQAFGKAWDSIRDANFTTIITSLILYNPGNWNMLPSSGLVRGFAATLLIGVLMSLFTGIVATRTLIRVFYKEKRV